jgi:acyl-CoA thioester hydrolase
MSFRVSIELNLDWSEMDLFGHINNVAYFKYVQAARVNYCELAGINTRRVNDPQSFAVASGTCRFIRPLYFPGTIRVETKADWIKNTSIQLSHRIINSNDEVAAEAEDVLVLFDYSANSKIPVSADTRSRISELEGKPF